MAEIDIRQTVCTQTATQYGHTLARWVHDYSWMRETVCTKCFAAFMVYGGRAWPGQSKTTGPVTEACPGVQSAAPIPPQAGRDD